MGLSLGGIDACEEEAGQPAGCGGAGMAAPGALAVAMGEGG